MRGGVSRYLRDARDAYSEAVIWMLGDAYEFHRFLTGVDGWTAKCQEYQNAGVGWTIMSFEIQLEAEDIVAKRGRDMVYLFGRREKRRLSNHCGG